MKLTKAQLTELQRKAYEEFSVILTSNEVIALCSAVVGLTEALEFYGDQEEWIDFKAEDLRHGRVSSHFDSDNNGQKARDSIAKFGVKNE